MSVTEQTVSAANVTESLDYAVFKRIFDVAFATASLVLAAPLLILIAAAILLTSGRPLLFSQERVGRHGARFRLYKFRTLPRRAADRADYEWSVDAPTRLSSFLRLTGLDEIPQLFNVVRGDMSLVGPRPERPYFVERFAKQQPCYAARHRLHVGITGWAQVNGWRGNTSIASRIEHDLYYLDHWSFGFDLQILLRTSAAFGRGLWSFLRLRSHSHHAGVN